MRRIEQDPEELREEQEAMSRAATPMHEQITIEFDSQDVIDGLGDYLHSPAYLDSFIS